MVLAKRQPALEFPLAPLRVARAARRNRLGLLAGHGVGDARIIYRGHETNPGFVIEGHRSQIADEMLSRYPEVVEYRSEGIAMGGMQCWEVGYVFEEVVWGWIVAASGTEEIVQSRLVMVVCREGHW